MQSLGRFGFLGFLSVVVFVCGALLLAPADAGAQDDVPPPESSGTSEVPTEPPPPPATEPPPPPATQPPPLATELPATEPPDPAETVPVTEEPTATEPLPGTESPVEATETVAPDETAIATTETTPDVVDPLPSEPPPAALGLPAPLPGSIGVLPGGGHNGLAMIWNYAGFGVSQEFGRTSFSVAHPTWYGYGAQYGLDGVSHPGLDISMPRVTWLYSPVSGTVVVSGNSAGFTFYGNGNGGVGELRIRTASGDEVILGHMGRIAVYPGEYVSIGQFVGVSGGFNGDHLQLEARQSGRIVDPRSSFITATIESALEQPQSETDEAILEEEVAEEAAVETESLPEPEVAESGETEVLAPVSNDSPPDSSGVESSPLAASLQGTGQRAGSWAQGVTTAVVEEPVPPHVDDVAAGLVETAQRQPVLNLVSGVGELTDVPEGVPAG